MIRPTEKWEVLGNPEIEPHAQLDLVKEHLTAVGMCWSVNAVNTGNSKINPMHHLHPRKLQAVRFKHIRRHPQFH